MKQEQMFSIEKKYAERCAAKSDINEHLPTLYNYASKCKHITETGVRSVVSSYSFAKGLLEKPDTKLIMIDLKKHPSITQFQKECEAAGLSTIFHEESDLVCPIEQTDLLFIDTWHVYGHLKRELSRWHSHVKKYIILHDTTVDEVYGETIRMGWNAEEQSRGTGIPVDEINRGLWPAVTEFLEAHPEWVLEQRWTNNNGLTVLRRI